MLELDAYIDILEQCLAVLPPKVVIHRLTGDGAKRDLIAPLWSADKKRVLSSHPEALRAGRRDAGKRAARLIACNFPRAAVYWI